MPVGQSRSRFKLQLSTLAAPEASEEDQHGAFFGGRFGTVARA
jgi:hypothetical protein